MRRRVAPLETVFVEVPDAAVEAYEAALSTACATVGFFFADEARGIWRIEGVRDVGADEAALQDALALAAMATGVAVPLGREPIAAEGWLARTYESFPEQKVGRRFVVRGTHGATGARPGRMVLTLAAMSPRGIEVARARRPRAGGPQR